MGYQVYEDREARDFGVYRWAGYGVPAVCDAPHCDVEINRGLGYRCENYVRYEYYDAEGNITFGGDWEDEVEIDEEGCHLNFCDEHSAHDTPGHTDETMPKPDTLEWVQHMLTDESWERWRSENPEKVAQMKERIENE